MRTIIYNIYYYSIVNNLHNYNMCLLIQNYSYFNLFVDTQFVVAP